MMPDLAIASFSFVLSLKCAFKFFTQFPDSSSSKDSACSAGDPDSIPGLGRSPGEGNGNPLQYSCLGNLMNRRARRATVHGVARVGHDLVTKQPAQRLRSTYSYQKIFGVFPVLYNTWLQPISHPAVCTSHSPPPHCPPPHTTHTHAVVTTGVCSCCSHFLTIRKSNQQVQDGGKNLGFLYCCQGAKLNNPGAVLLLVKEETDRAGLLLGQAANIRLHAWPPSQWTLNFVPGVYRNGLSMENQIPPPKRASRLVLGLSVA